MFLIKRYHWKIGMANWKDIQTAKYNSHVDLGNWLFPSTLILTLTNYTCVTKYMFLLRTLPNRLFGGFCTTPIAVVITIIVPHLFPWTYWFLFIPSCKIFYQFGDCVQSIIIPAWIYYYCTIRCKIVQRTHHAHLRRWWFGILALNLPLQTLIK